MLSAAGLKGGSVHTAAEMNNHAKLLMDSGVFDHLTYKFDGVDLIDTLNPFTTLYPFRLDNLPLAGGPELDAKLHSLVPLYHGKVPADGTLLDGVRAALEQMLATQGMNATIIATSLGEAGTRILSAMSFSIAAPPVEIGTLQVQGVSPAFKAKVNALADKQTGTAFDTADFAANLVEAFTSLDAEEGYAAAKVHVVQSSGPQVSAASIDIPFSITIDEGHIYKLGAIGLPADPLVSPAEIDKITSSASGTAKGASVRGVWALIASRYHSKGYLDFATTPHAQFDETAGTVNDAVELNPGSVYHLALLKLDNVGDQLRKLLMRNWQMFPGDPFDESYVSGFLAKAQSEDPVLQRILAGVKVSYDVRAAPSTHDVNLMIRLKRHE